MSKSYYYGYKLHHLVTSVRGISDSLDLIKASVHDVHNLSEIINYRLTPYILIADKGYLLSTYQLDLFTSCQLSLQNPKRANQERMLNPVIFIKVRKLIETLSSQLCDPFML